MRWEGVGYFAEGRIITLVMLTTLTLPSKCRALKTYTYEVVEADQTVVGSCFSFCNLMSRCQKKEVSEADAVSTTVGAVQR